MKFVRKLLKLLVLHGPLWAWWITRKSRLLEKAYLCELLRSCSGSQSAPKSGCPRGKLNKILLIADVMWESGELVPELERIAKVQLCDLNPALKRSHPDRGAQGVIGSLETLTKQFPSYEPDVILFYARPAILSEEAFDLLRQRWHCPLLGMNLDDKKEFFPYGIYNSGNDNYRHWAARFDLSLSSSLAVVRNYRQAGLSARYCPPGFHAHPDTATVPTRAEFEFLFSFVGSWKPERATFVEQLLEAGVPIEVFGSGWKHGRWVESPRQVFRGSQMNLGLGQITATGGLTNLKARDFECPGAGGCYMTSFDWELARHFEVGKEILCYRNLEELIELYSFYRRDPDGCLRIAQLGHRRCLAEHTWEKRFRTVFLEMGFQV